MTFAQGALRAALWLQSRKSGLYDMAGCARAALIAAAAIAALDFKKKRCGFEHFRHEARCFHSGRRVKFALSSNTLFHRIPSGRGAVRFMATPAFARLRPEVFS